MPAPTNLTRLPRKLSPATVAPDLLRRLDIPDSPEEIILFAIYGAANGVALSKPGSEKEWVKFKGHFEAIREDDPEHPFVSGACFIPQPLSDMLYAQLNEAKEKDAKAMVRFACLVKIVQPTKGKPSATGYEYRVEPMMDAQESSPIADLRKQVQDKRAAMNALPAPTAASTSEPKKTPAMGAAGRK